MEPTLLTPIENSCKRDFSLLRAPCTYTLTEMFDDRNTDAREQFVAQTTNQVSRNIPIKMQIQATRVFKTLRQLHLCKVKKFKEITN